MSGLFRAMALLVAIAIAIGIGGAVYNAGVTAGLAEATRQAAANGDAIVVPWGHGPYWHGPGGFGLFGILFAILGFFLVIGLLRAAFGWGRWGGSAGRHGPGGWGGRSGRVEDWHRELHRREAGETPSATGSA